MTHAVTLLLILVFFGKMAAMVPLASLAGILVVVSYNMSEWRSFRDLLTAPRSDIVVLVLTFGLTVFVDLTVAVQVGVVAAALLFMRRMADVTQVEAVTEALRERMEDPAEISWIRGRSRMIGQATIPERVEVFEVDGPFFFGAADKLREVLGEVAVPPKVFILRLRKVPAIDATGIHALIQLGRQCREQKTRLLLSGARANVRRKILRADRLQHFGRHDFCSDFQTALRRASELLALQDAGG